LGRFCDGSNHAGLVSRLQPEASASFIEPCVDRSLKLAATSA